MIGKKTEEQFDNYARGVLGLINNFEHEMPEGSEIVSRMISITLENTYGAYSVESTKRVYEETDMFLLGILMGASAFHPDTKENIEKTIEKFQNTFFNFYAIFYGSYMALKREDEIAHKMSFLKKFEDKDGKIPEKYIGQLIRYNGKHTIRGDM